MRAPHELGGHSDGETPLPIPNREVKPVSADGTRGAIPRESRTPPISSRAPEGALFLCPSMPPVSRGSRGLSGSTKLLAPLRVELAQPAYALADGRVRHEQRREPLLGE